MGVCSCIPFAAEIMDRQISADLAITLTGISVYTWQRCEMFEKWSRISVSNESAALPDSCRVFPVVIRQEMMLGSVMLSERILIKSNSAGAQSSPLLSFKAGIVIKLLSLMSMKSSHRVPFRSWI